MQEFIPGQRWINEAELELGLGTIMEVEHRTVTVVFIGTGDTRSYAKQGAPLSRVQFSSGDTIQHSDGQLLEVVEAREEEGLLFYIGLDSGGNEHVVPESWLDCFIPLNRPLERLFSGQIDKNKWFDLRNRCWQAIGDAHQSNLRGLTGSRTSLIPHQLYIAHEVARRYAPRVLLADEVGLGKTIEAGLILNQQLLSGRANRVLIVVPETLLHQWLVEMLRRFALRFSLFDRERCEAMLADGEAIDGNPFYNEQLVLCSLDFLRDHPEYFALATEADWDLLVVDEAHHLAWSEQAPSTEYQLVAELAAQIPGVLLLTATPEQLGKQSHFARLRLLDSDRFSSYEKFLDEEQRYKPIADAVELLLSDLDFDETAFASLESFFDEDDNQHLFQQLYREPDNQAVRNALLDHLLDRHGTGRILFRNTRAAVQGFPARRVHACSLPTPAPYSAEQLATAAPEQRYRNEQPHSEQPWHSFDPRVDWLLQHLKANRNDKQLVIAASADTALDLAEALRIRAGIHAAVFHEGMSIIERDRAGAFFADEEDGSQLLICSEIGSEGRNFQFAHHLVLFDLPLNPDLLEQRIGRLDRIGQKHEIQIHLPYLENSAQQVLFHWYQQGLNAFEQPNPAAFPVFTELQTQLANCPHNSADIDQLTARASHLNSEMNAKLQQGRDRLLEYNSCRPAVAAQLVEQAEREQSDSELAELMEAVFDCYGVESEAHSATSTVIRPAADMSEPFPGLPDDGLTITYDRDTALSYEDISFLSGDHSMVINALEMVTSSEKGNTSVITIPAAPLRKLAITPGSLLLETLFVMEGPQQTSRYLPPQTLRLLIDEQGRQLGHILLPHLIDKMRQPVKRNIATQVVKAKRSEIETLLARCEQQAGEKNSELLDAAAANAQQLLGDEIERLKALQKINPSVRESEISYFVEQLAAVQESIANTALRLDAIRVIVAA